MARCESGDKRVELSRARTLHELCMGLEVLTMLSSMGYVVLSGKMQVERQETTFCTPVSYAECRTLSLIWMFLLWGWRDLSDLWGGNPPKPCSYG